ncbi:AI-2E family transporter [Paeniglutamicibacter kerguelensis]|uniref:PurR-regulated permease PerM n=1 Tax=Paeniglutamicibacter kerguelensis TaxID=254788 RepID=A0ABS4XAZ0_9MICC|nr:AI-2E family transporter [Paeniglutamicibacter kerguelensis]MBP2385627.1 putative PurR-regulated permease PerM [Paeniglutamicibacter kerguelensis]
MQPTGQGKQRDGGGGLRPRGASALRMLPPGIDLVGKGAWRVLGIIGVLAVFVFLVSRLEEIVVPFLVALLLTAFLKPLVNWLVAHGWRKWLAIIVALVFAAGVIVGLVVLVETQIGAGLPEVQKRSLAAYKQFRDYLDSSPLQLTSAQFDAFLVQLGQEVQQHANEILSGALVVGKTAGRLLAGTLLTVFATIFMLIDGANVWRWTVRLFPRGARPAVDGAGQAGWNTLTSFVRVQILVAAGNGIGIGLFAFFLGLPMVVPIAILVFLASFIPVIGAIVTGALAVLVALVFVGPIQALVMLGGVLLVHLLEAHVMQPLAMGAAVKVHPLAVVFAVAAGSYLAGIPGALFAVPTVAVVNAMVSYAVRGTWRAAPAPEYAQGPGPVPGSAESPEMDAGTDGPAM